MWVKRTLEFTGRNRLGWDSIAANRPPQPAAFFRAGGTTLERAEIDLLPDVAGRRLLHLACATGNESMSWAVRGARVTAVDISDDGLAIARAVAEEAGLDIDFITADMFQLPDDLGRFDYVYASSGVVCWCPDIDEWAQIIADHLELDGSFLLSEHHPIWEVLGVRAEDRLEPTVSYFGRSEPTDGTYDQAKRPAGSSPQTPLTAFVWPISDVVMAFVRAGLHIEHFGERVVSDMYTGLSADAAARLPATYELKVTKPTWARRIT